MKLLLHTCCGPCTLYPYSVLSRMKINTTAFFYNPNIHPFKEFQKRLSTLNEVTQHFDIPSVLNAEYGLKSFLRKVVFNEESRCSLCYSMRLQKTASYAAENGYDAFSSTLFYSRYQQHDVMKQTCEQLADTYSIRFFYDDFREGWQKGIDLSKEMQLYRQPYCGCIYSEQERYDKSLRKKQL